MAWCVMPAATSCSTSILRSAQPAGRRASGLQEGLDVTELGDRAQLSEQLPRRLKFNCAPSSSPSALQARAMSIPVRSLVGTQSVGRRAALLQRRVRRHCLLMISSRLADCRRAGSPARTGPSLVCRLLCGAPGSCGSVARSNFGVGSSRSRRGELDFRNESYLYWARTGPGSRLINFRIARLRGSEVTLTRHFSTLHADDRQKHMTSLVILVIWVFE